MRRALCLSLALVFFADVADAAHMATGFKVGEVTQTSAIVWTRVTRDAERNWNGVKPEKKREPRQNKYEPSPIKIEDREGAVPGAAGEVRVTYFRNDVKGDPKQMTDWVGVKAEHDFTHQFHLQDLEPDAHYSLKIEARDDASDKNPATMEGEFRTPAPKDQWQNVTFTVISCQGYWDLDNKDGFNIYPAMLKLHPDFVVPTGDTVYLDSDAPRARTVDLARYHWHRMYSFPRHITFHQYVPGYWEKDDHDAWCNDCWPTMKAPWMNPLTFKEGLEIYREQVPMGDKIYRTVRWGKGLQIWMVEGRDFRSPNNRPDGPDKVIWGKEQRDWLLKSILESDADFRVLISPTPIVGPDRPRGKNDNYSNNAFATAGNEFRNWTAEHNLKNLYVCCGDRHWQYLSIDPKTGLYEFDCGPASDAHAGGSPGRDPKIQPFHRVKGGFLSVTVSKKDDQPRITFRHHDVNGKVVHEFDADPMRSGK